MNILMIWAAFSVLAQDYVPERMLQMERIQPSDATVGTKACVTGAFASLQRHVWAPAAWFQGPRDESEGCGDGFAANRHEGGWEIVLTRKIPTDKRSDDEFRRVYLSEGKPRYVQFEFITTTTKRTEEQP